MSTVLPPSFKKKPEEPHAAERLLVEVEVQVYDNPIRSALLGGSNSHRIVPVAPGSVAVDAIRSNTVSQDMLLRLRKESDSVREKVRDRSIELDALRATNVIASETITQLRQDSGRAVVTFRERDKAAVNHLRADGQRFALGAMKGYFFSDVDLEKIIAILGAD